MYTKYEHCNSTHVKQLCITPIPKYSPLTLNSFFMRTCTSIKNELLCYNITYSCHRVPIIKHIIESKSLTSLSAVLNIFFFVFLIKRIAWALEKNTKMLKILQHTKTVVVYITHILQRGTIELGGGSYSSCVYGIAMHTDTGVFASPTPAIL